MLRLPARCESSPPTSRSQHSLPPASPPTPRPILALSSRQQTLYVEHIQSSESSHHEQPMVWVRPLVLSGSPVLDLRHSADLLWPARAFSPAFAEDLLPLLDQAVPSPEARQILQQFMTQVWQDTQNS